MEEVRTVVTERRLSFRLQFPVYNAIILLTSIAGGTGRAGVVAECIWWPEIMLPGPCKPYRPVFH